LSWLQRKYEIGVFWRVWHLNDLNRCLGTHMRDCSSYLGEIRVCSTHSMFRSFREKIFIFKYYYLKSKDCVVLIEFMLGKDIALQKYIILRLPFFYVPGVSVYDLIRYSWICVLTRHTRVFAVKHQWFLLELELWVRQPSCFKSMSLSHY
jgi:hypothetical protein